MNKREHTKKVKATEEYKSAVRGIALYYSTIHLKSALEELRKTELKDAVETVEKLIRKIKAVREKDAAL